MGFLPVAVLLFSALSGPVTASTYEEIREKAESAFDEKSYALARELYANLEGELTADQQDWVRFRLADLSWRIALSSERQDHTILNQARNDLQKMVAEWQGNEDRDSLLIHVYSSLGESHWGFGNAYNWQQAQSFYLQAIERLSQLAYSDSARRQFLEIIEKPLLYDSKRYHYGPAFWPLDQAEDAVKLARSTDEVAMTHFHLAKSLQQQGIQAHGYAAACTDANGLVWLVESEKADAVILSQEPVSWLGRLFGADGVATLRARTTATVINL